MNDDDDDDDDNNIDAIYDADEEFLDSDKTDGKYYIGLIGADGERLMLSTVSPATFYAFPFQDIHTYLDLYSMTENVVPGVKIIQLRLQPDGTHLAVDKTRYLVRIQRWWKNRYAQFRARWFRALVRREVSGICVYNQK